MIARCRNAVNNSEFFGSPNNTYDVRFNGESHNTGNLLEDFEPSVNPPKEIDDSEDKKPEDWVDTKRISDPDAKKVGTLVWMRAVRIFTLRFQPDDWDEDAPYELPDEDAVKPEGWLDEEPEFIPDPGEPGYLISFE